MAAPVQTKIRSAGSNAAQAVVAELQEALAPHDREKLLGPVHRATAAKAAFPPRPP